MVSDESSRRVRCGERSHNGAMRATGALVRNKAMHYRGGFLVPVSCSEHEHGGLRCEARVMGRWGGRDNQRECEFTRLLLFRHLLRIRMPSPRGWAEWVGMAAS